MPRMTKEEMEEYIRIAEEHEPVLPAVGDDPHTTFGDIYNPESTPAQELVQDEHGYILAASPLSAGVAPPGSGNDDVLIPDVEYQVKMVRPDSAVVVHELVDAVLGDYDYPCFETQKLANGECIDFEPGYGVAFEEEFSE